MTSEQPSLQNGLKKYIAPILAIGFGLIVVLIAGLNLPHKTSGIFDSSAPTYFIQPVELNHLYVVEPNLEGYMSDNKEPPDFEDVLYGSLDELHDRYVIDQTRIIQVERKGITVPNLYVYVHPNADLEQVVEDVAGQSDKT